MARHAQKQAEAEEAEAKAILGELVCKVEGHAWRPQDQLCDYCGINWMDQFRSPDPMDQAEWDKFWNATGTASWNWNTAYTTDTTSSITLTDFTNAVTALENTYPATWTTYVTS